MANFSLLTATFDGAINESLDLESAAVTYFYLGASLLLSVLFLERNQFATDRRTDGRVD